MFSVFCILTNFVTAPQLTGTDDFRMPTVVRVRLVRELRSVNNITVVGARFAASSDKDTKVIDKKNDGGGVPPIKIEAKDSKLQISVGEADTFAQKMFYLESADVDNPLGIQTSSKKIRHYRGRLWLAAEGDHLLVTNVIDLETYLRGVVPAEMAPDAPIEALKAQAIAARTFALKVRVRYRPSGFDLDDTTMSQTYGGIEAEKPSGDEAVKQTERMVLEHDGRLIWADYYDDCGGVTAPGSNAGDYPPPVIDGPDDKSDFCQIGQHHKWSVVLIPQDITKRLSSDERRKIGVFRSVDVLDRDVSGRASLISINGDDGSIELKGNAFRALIGYDRLPSTLFKIKSEDNGFKFEGRGFGHGHGLCQCGAIGMASAPYQKSYADILLHYFPGAHIRKLIGAASN